MLNKVNEKLKEHDARLLFLTKTGSHLYGTASENSDVDYKGIYLPSKESLFLKEDKVMIDLSTNKSNEANTKDDIDCELYSIHEFLRRLGNGETNSVDLLFAIWSPTTTNYIDPKFKELMKSNYKKLITKNANAFIGYANSQTRVYNIKGKRFEELQIVISELERGILQGYNLTKIAEDIMEKQLTYVRYSTDNETISRRYIWVLGRQFILTCSPAYVLDRLKCIERSYGKRVNNDSNSTVDFKALSHALRVCYEAYELLKHEFITFPLKNSNEILFVKQGRDKVEDTVNKLTLLIEKVDDLVTTSKLPAKVDKEILTKVLKSLYKESLYDKITRFVGKYI